MLHLMRKEINAFFSSLTAYIVMTVFLTAMGLFVWVFPQTSVLESGYADIYPLFGIAPYVFMFLIPAITMRVFAEEKKSGTIELLLTQPLTGLGIVLGKYTASLALALFALLPTGLYYVTVWLLGSPQGNIDSAAVAGSYLGLFMLAAVFTAIGVFASSLTENQVVSFILAVFGCFLLYDGLTSIASVNVWSSYTYFLGQLGIDHHYSAMSRGLLDSRNLFYFLSLTAVMLGATRMVLQSRKW